MESTNAPRSTYPIPKMALSDAEYFFFFAFAITAPPIIPLRHSVS
jgi:hypothetical protein